MSWPADECVCTGGMTYRDDCPACARIKHLEDLIERWAKAKKSFHPSKLTGKWIEIASDELYAAEDALKQEAEKL